MLWISMEFRSSKMGRRLAQACVVVGMAVALIVNRPAFSQEGPVVSAQGAFARHSCGYYSYTMGQLLVSFAPEAPLEPGSRVYMHYGWEYDTGGRERTVWSEVSDVLMKQVRLNDSGVSVWDASVVKELHYRSTSRAPIDALDFVFRIEHPNGAMTWEKGIETDWGYFRVNWESVRKPCVSADWESVPYVQLNVTNVP